LAIIIVPVVLLSGSLIDGVQFLRNAIEHGDAIIPPPGDRVASWPAFAKPVVDAWQLASDNLQSTVVTYREEVTAVVKALLGAVAKTSIGVLQFILSIIIAGVLLVYADEGGNTMIRIFKKIGGDRGEEYAKLSEVTIRNVVKGILGVAVIQTLLAGIGFACGWCSRRWTMDLPLSSIRHHTSGCWAYYGSCYDLYVFYCGYHDSSDLYDLGNIHYDQR
jgi:predicted PurR-regulated permease PerM